jgi:histone-arginine methyltransferase CARM1
MEAKARSSPSEAAVKATETVVVRGVGLRVVGGSLDVKREVGKDLELCCNSTSKLCSLRFSTGGEVVYKLEVRGRGAVYSPDSNALLFRADEGSAVAVFASDTDAARIQNHVVRNFSAESEASVFDQRTEEASAKQYFQFYGYLSQQQNMMQDYIRTSTFQTAILHNLADFKDKVVLDVGAGTGVLSFFALQAGARMVYAVEASNMAAHCAKLVQANKYSDRMKVIPGKIEEVNIPEEVDVIISEPMGYMLFNERMLETYLHAKKWLKPEGKMYPTQGILYVAPFSDEALFLEQMGKTYFWQQSSFHGVDVSVLHSEAMAEYFRQPIVDTFDIRILMSRPVGHTTDFTLAHEKELHKIDIPLQFKTQTTGYMHGLAFWFDVAFIGGKTTVWLSTAPFQPLTHWYQVWSTGWHWLRSEVMASLCVCRFACCCNNHCL